MDMYQVTAAKSNRARENHGIPHRQESATALTTYPIDLVGYSTRAVQKIEIRPKSTLDPGSRRGARPGARLDIGRARRNSQEVPRGDPPRLETLRAGAEQEGPGGRLFSSPQAGRDHDRQRDTRAGWPARPGALREPDGVHGVCRLSRRANVRRPARDAGSARRDVADSRPHDPHGYQRQGRAQSAPHR